MSRFKVGDPALVIGASPRTPEAIGQTVTLERFYAPFELIDFRLIGGLAVLPNGEHSAWQVLFDDGANAIFHERYLMPLRGDGEDSKTTASKPREVTV